MSKSKSNSPRNKGVETPSKTQKQIYRQPVWSADEVFSINGTTLEFLANFVAPYRTLINTVDSILASGELEGKIGIEFFYENRELVTDKDSRLAGLKEVEEKRLNHWRTLVETKQKEMEILAEKANIADKAMNDESFENKITSESVIDSDESEDNVIVFTPVVAES